MGYLYEELKKALGGEKLVSSKQSVIKDWSPNRIKAILISLDSIIVVGHLNTFSGCVEGFPISPSEVMKDIDTISRTNYGKPKINTLLSKRSFSCLEEIYIDRVYMGYPKVVDILGYVSDLKTSVSRIRYFGYGDITGKNLVSYLSESYKKAGVTKNYEYSIAEDKEKPFNLEYRKVNNPTWYKNYFLRPQYYKLDSEKGNLSLHFKKFESDFSNYLLERSGNLKGKKLEDMLNQAISCDLEKLEYLKRVDSMLSILSKRKDDKVVSIVLDAFRGVVSGLKSQRGFSRKRYEKLLEGQQYLSKLYDRYRVWDASDKLEDVKEEDILPKASKGFLDIHSILDMLCLNATEVLRKQGYKDLVGVSLWLNSSDIPNGDFRAKFLEGGSSVSDLSGYFEYLKNLLGCDF